MPATYEPISTQTISSGTGTVSFTSIPSTYTDLVLIGSIIPTNAGAAYLLYRINTDTGSNYTQTQWYWTNTSGGRGSIEVLNTTNIEIIGNQFQTLGAFATRAMFCNYANTNTWKHFIVEGRAPDNTSRSAAAVWQSTSAITSVQVIASPNAAIGTGSVFTLFGIKAA